MQLPLSGYFVDCSDWNSNASSGLALFFMAIILSEHEIQAAIFPFSDVPHTVQVKTPDWYLHSQRILVTDNTYDKNGIVKVSYLSGQIRCW